jgi:hypothetical protein
MAAMFAVSCKIDLIILADQTQLQLDVGKHFVIVVYEQITNFVFLVIFKAEAIVKPLQITGVVHVAIHVEVRIYRQILEGFNLASGDINLAERFEIVEAAAFPRGIRR